MAKIIVRIKPWHCGLAAALLTAVVFTVGWVHSGGTGLELALAAAVVAGVGFGTFVLSRAKAYAWLVAVAFGLLFGLESANELFWEVPFERQCLIALITALFWLVLFFILGGLAEFIRTLHHLSHRIGLGVEERMKEQMEKKKINAA